MNLVWNEAIVGKGGTPTDSTKEQNQTENDLELRHLINLANPWIGWRANHEITIRYRPSAGERYPTNGPWWTVCGYSHLHQATLRILGVSDYIHKPFTMDRLWI